MRPNEIARAWLGERPLEIVVCGAPEVGRLLLDDRVHVFCARTSAELARIRTSVALNVAVIAEKPWSGGDALVIARAIRMYGLGTVLLASSEGTAQQWLRERIAVQVATPDFQQKLLESVWFACFETEIVRRASETSSPPAPRPRYVMTRAGGIEPSKSTMTYVFGDLDLNPTQPVLIAPPVPASRTVELAPSESVLRLLREEAARAQHPQTPRTATILLAALVLAAFAILGLRWL
jgi:hypothetical protein